jgi:orotate phosphoribosyltransferase
MEHRAIIIKSKKDKSLKIKIIPGHFATNHSHINYYIDMTSIKTKHINAKVAGGVLADNYINNTEIDTIVCMDGTEMIAAFLADKLTQSGYNSLNSDKPISVITPEFNSNNQLIFRDNIQKQVWGKNILLLIASATTGKSIISSSECIKYYGGKITGISAIFSAKSSYENIEIKPIFDPSDLPEYNTYPYDECPFCKAGQKIDAIVNSYGYSKI